MKLKKLLPLRMAEAAAPPRLLKVCTECGKCCTYVSVEINAPNSVSNATDMLWYLYHENISLYRDGDGEWSVVFETRCRNLEARPAVRRLRGPAADLPRLRQHHLRGQRPRGRARDPHPGGVRGLPPRAPPPKLFRKIEAKYLPPHLRAAPPRAASRG